MNYKPIATVLYIGFVLPGALATAQDNPASDQVAPKAIITSPQDQFATNAQSIQVVVSFDADGRGSGNVHTVELARNGVVIGTFRNPPNEKTGTHTFMVDLSSFRNRIVTFQAFAYQGAPEAKLKGSSNIISVIVDDIAPVFTNLLPVPDSIVTINKPTISVQYSDNLIGVNTSSVRLTLDGVDVTAAAVVTETGLSFAPQLPLSDGLHAVHVEISDRVGNRAAFDWSFGVDTAPPAIVFDTPTKNAFVNTRTPLISIAFSDALAGVDRSTLQVTVNLVDLTSFGTTSSSLFILQITPEMGLTDGQVVIGVRLADRAGNVAQDVSSFTTDTLAPALVVRGPVTSGAANRNPISVFGTVQDQTPTTISITGTVAETIGQANISAGTFDVPVMLTSNTVNRLLVRAIDSAGNESPAAVINDLLHDDVVPANPMPMATVITTQEAATVISGIAEAGIRVLILSGSRVVAEGSSDTRMGFYKILTPVPHGTTTTFGVRAVDLAGNASGIVAVSVTQGAQPFQNLSSSINLVSGHNQEGIAGQPLPNPAAVIVTNPNGDPIAGQPVAFQVLRGNGHIQGSRLFVSQTGADGKARAILTLDPDHRVENVFFATFPGNAGSPVLFVARSLPPNPGGMTSIQGVVLGPQLQAIRGVTLRVPGTFLSTQSDAQGEFRLLNAPAGRHHLFVDGTTATLGGPYANLQYDLFILEGQENHIPGSTPIFLPPLDTASMIEVSPTQGGVLTTSLLPGLRLEVAPGAATFPNGSKSGKLFLTIVPIGRTPMPLPNGLFSSSVIAVQPGGTHFDPPLTVTFPNTEKLAPGSKAKLMSFSHDAGEYVQVGTGTVTPDGALIKGDPGIGIREGAWHAVTPTVPTPTTCCTGRAQAEDGECIIKTFVICANANVDINACENDTFMVCNCPAPACQVEVIAQRVDAKISEKIDRMVAADALGKAKAAEMGALAGEIRQVGVEIEGTGPCEVNVTVRLEFRGGGQAKILDPESGDPTQSFSRKVIPPASIAFSLLAEEPSTEKDDIVIVVELNGKKCAEERFTVILVEFLDSRGALIERVFTVESEILNEYVRGSLSLNAGITGFLPPPSFADNRNPIKLELTGSLSPVTGDVLTLEVEDTYLAAKRRESFRETGVDTRSFVLDDPFNYSDPPTLVLLVSQGTTSLPDSFLVEYDTRREDVPIVRKTVRRVSGSSSFESASITFDFTLTQRDSQGLRSLVIQTLQVDSMAVDSQSLSEREPFSSVFEGPNGLRVFIKRQSLVGDSDRNSLQIELTHQGSGIISEGADLIETSPDSNRYVTPRPMLGGVTTGGDPTPRLPERAVFRVRVTDATHTENSYTIALTGDLEGSKTIIGKVAVSKISQGVHQSKRIIAAREFASLLPEVFEQLEDDHDFIHGNKNPHWVIIGAAAGAAVVVLNVLDATVDEAFLKLVDWWDGKDADSRIFRVHDSGGLTVGLHSIWDEFETLAEQKGWKDSDENHYAERAEILDDLRDMDKDDFFVFHGHSIGEQDTDPCKKVLQVGGLTGYDTFGFRDPIPHEELTQFIDTEAPGIVVINGCASFFDPLKNAFVAKGTKLYIGWTETVPNAVAGAGIKVLLKELLDGRTIAQAINSANSQPAVVANNNLRERESCPKSELKAQATGPLTQSIYDLLGIKPE